MPERRGHGEGSIYRRESDGTWCCGVELGWVDGKWKRKVIDSTTCKEIAEQLKQVLRNQQQGLPVATERQTVGQFLARWLAEIVKPTRRAMIYRSYEQFARCPHIPALDRVQLAKLTPQEVESSAVCTELRLAFIG
jgi:integrase